MIILIPEGGLCNRMRVIASGLALSDKHGIRVKIFWIRNNEANCKFSDLFLPISFKNVEIIEVNYNPLRYGMFYAQNIVTRVVYRLIRVYQTFFFDQRVQGREAESFFKLDQAVNYAKKRTLLIQTCYIFYENTLYYKYFIPIDDIKSKLDKETSSFTDQVIGVHIRRTDLGKEKESPTSLFIEEIKNIIDKNPDTLFFVASDSLEEKSVLIQQFGNRILTSHEHVSRLDRKGMEDAVIDLYKLSRTKMIIGTYYSSFSETAAIVGGVPLQVISKTMS